MFGTQVDIYESNRTKQNKVPDVTSSSFVRKEITNEITLERLRNETQKNNVNQNKGFIYYTCTENMCLLDLQSPGWEGGTALNEVGDRGAGPC